MRVTAVLVAFIGLASAARFEMRATSFHNETVVARDAPDFAKHEARNETHTEHKRSWEHGHHNWTKPFQA